MYLFHKCIFPEFELIPSKFGHILRKFTTESTDWYFFIDIFYFFVRSDMYYFINYAQLYSSVKMYTVINNCSVVLNIYDIFLNIKIPLFL